VKLRHEQLKKRLGAAGLGVEQLAEAVERPGLSGARALAAARNWVRGSDHPRCEKQDLEKIASFLGCELGDVTRFTSQVRHHRGSPRKAQLVAAMIRGKSFLDADNMLRFSNKRAAVNIRKALDAARSDAEMAGLDPSTLVVAESRVDEGPHIKRFRPKDRGRAHQILKRTSHITVSVEERG
jgi:large subunit ribosomal protein L22